MDGLYRKIELARKISEYRCDQLISRADELEVPLLKVDQDTLGTVEVIEQAFGHVRLHEAVKATYAFRLVEEHCRLADLLNAVGLEHLAIGSK